MAKGDGSITKVRNGVWRVCISCGTDPLTGKRRKAQRIVHGTKADAKKVRDELNERASAGVNLSSESTPFDEFAETWKRARVASGDFSDNTLRRDRYAVDLLDEYLAGIPLSAITPQLVESVYGRLRLDRGLSGTTVHHAHEALATLLGKAVDYRLIAENPCDRVKAPKRSDNNRRSLTAEEASMLLKRLCSEEVARLARIDSIEARRAKVKRAPRSKASGLAALSCVHAARLGLATGARRGEVLATRRKDLDLDAQCVEICRSIDPAMKVTAPKNGRSRTVYFDRHTALALEQWLEIQERQLESIGAKADPETPAFCSEKGGFLNPNNFSRWWRGFVADAGLPDLAFHELRHTQATLLLANGTDVKTVQNRMGHAKSSTTLDMYAHALPENDRAAANLIGSLFSHRGERSEAENAAARRSARTVEGITMDTQVRQIQRPGEGKQRPSSTQIASLSSGSDVPLSPDCPLARPKPPQTAKQATSTKLMTCSFNGGA